MRRLVEDERAPLAAKLVQATAPGRTSRGQKPLENEAVGGKSRRAERTHQRAGSGNRPDLAARLAHPTHDMETRIVYEWSPGVAHQGEALSFLQTPYHVRRHPAFVVIVQGAEPGLDPVNCQEAETVSGVLGKHRVDVSQDRERARADVARIADWSGDDVEHARRTGRHFARIVFPSHFGSGGSGARFLVYGGRMSCRTRNPTRGSVARARTPSA